MSGSSQDLLNEAAESFLARVRQGELPSVCEYADRYPSVAEQIRRLFPTLAAVERVGEKQFGGAEQIDHSPPEQLGDYLLRREVSRGGMGVVYEAFQTSLGRRVAIKTLKRNLESDRQACLRFDREARAAAQLHHTNIVPVYDIGEDRGIHYYSMQYIDGQSLDKVWNELRHIKNAPSMPASPSLARRLADSLTQHWPEAAHSQSPIKEADAEEIHARRPEVERNQANPMYVDASGEATECVSNPLLDSHEAKSSEPADAETEDISSGVHLLLEVGASQGGASRRGVSDRHYFRNVARVAVQIIDAVAYTHARGVLHRDIKPSNIILDTQGRAWVTDFGLATDGSAPLTETGDIVGTLRYMSPERFKQRADERSDIYSIGLTIYEFLTLCPAYQGSNRARLIDSIQNSRIAKVSQLEPHVPHDLETIVLTATEEDPKRRYQTAEAFAEDLRHFLAGRPIAARRANWTKRCWLWCQRNPVMASLLAAVALLLATIACVATLAAWSAHHHANVVQRAELQGRRLLYDSYVNEARAVRWSQRPGRRFDSMAAITKAAKLLPTLGWSQAETNDNRLQLRNQAIASLSLADLKLDRVWKGEDLLTGYAFDQNVQRFARGDMNGNISIHRMSTNDQLRFLPGFGLPVWGIQFSRDGKWLAACYHHHSPAIVKVWHLESGDARLTVENVVPDGAVDFSPDGRQIAIVSQTGTTEIRELSSGEITKTLTRTPAAAHLRFNRTATSLAVACLDPQNSAHHVVVWNLETNLRTKLPHGDRVVHVDWHPSGTRLATACADRHAYVWDVPKKEQEMSIGPHNSDVRCVTFNSTGRLLALSTFRQTLLYDAMSGEQEVIADGQCTRFSVDDQRLSYRDGSTLGRWDVATAPERIRWATYPNVRAVDVDEGETGFVALAGSEGIEIHDLVAKGRIAHLAGHSLAAVFRPDGSELYTSGALGVFSWPLKWIPSGDVVKLQLGPPKKIRAPTGTRGRVGIDSMGRRIVVELKDCAQVIDLQQEAEVSTTGYHKSLHYVALSPDGKWVATGTWSGNGVKIWEADTGKHVTDLLTGCKSARVQFSPDNRWLLVGIGDRICVFESPTWKLAHEFRREGAGNLPGPAAFSQDGAIAAVTVSLRRIQLVDTQSWRILAEVESPYGDVEQLHFADRGHRLVAAIPRALLLWDFARIRTRLRSLGLDWGDQPLPHERVVVRSTQLTVNLGDYGDKARSEEAASLAQQESRARNWVRAIELYCEAIEADPQNGLAHNLLAWTLVTCPDQTLHDAKRAVRHAEMSVELNPTEAANWNTLGVAFYRTGRWRDAVDALERSQALDPTTFVGHNGYFLAMAYWQLGEATAAHRWFEEAITASSSDPIVADELRLFRAEAIELCGFGSGDEPR